MIYETTATRKIASLSKKIRAVQGGCLGIDTPVLMFDLTTKKVQDIVVGDLLMGIDGTARTVLELYHGSSNLFRVKQKKGNDYIVNDKHILVFEDQGKDLYKTTKGKKVYQGRYREDGLKKFVAEDFYNLPKRSGVRRYKGIKGSISFESQEVSLDPYFLGLWLGDGTSRNASITNIDTEIKSYLFDEVPTLYDVNANQKDRVTTNLVKTQGKHNDIIQRLRQYNLILNKNIPMEYIRNSREVRLQVLAGLIDSDGTLNRDSRSGVSKGYTITQKNKRLADNLALLSRTLGFYTTVRPKVATMKRKDGTVYSCDVYNVNIFCKDYTEIPVKIERKKCQIISEKNPLRSSVGIEPIGFGDYYGFELDGDHLFMLDDFTITHNTSAGKTISTLIVLIAMAQIDEKPTITSVVSESLPHLKRGALRDFLNILKEHNYYKEENYSRTEYRYTFETGSIIEFFGVDQPHKLRGARRDRLYINECNNVSKEAFDQLEVRTKEVVFLDWNPTNEFWFYTDVLVNRDDVDHITLTYKDNEALSPEIIHSIETRRNNKQWWKVYGEGQLGESEGRIYRGWDVSTLATVPHEAKYLCTGLDFGYTNDPTAAVDIYQYNGAYIFDEVVYRTGLSNRNIHLLLTEDGSQRHIRADSAEPKSIDELKLAGLSVVPADKGRGSVAQGIQFVQDQKIYVTASSTNLIREYRNYQYQENNTGGYTNVPEGLDDHLMDAIRYGLGGDMRRIIPNERLKRQMNNMFESTTRL